MQKRLRGMDCILKLFDFMCLLAKFQIWKKHKFLVVRYYHCLSTVERIQRGLE